MNDATRQFVCSVAVKAAQAVDYVGAGTIEFIADASQGLRADAIWFMEMNTRLQVEHPVTEAITGFDLVEWQLRVAGGERLPCLQEDIHLNGWAMEARLYAENPTAGFLPSIGPLKHLRLPTDIRVDSGVEQGGEVTGHYDPMIAKLIVHAPNRHAAARRLAAACAAVEVWPVRTNAAFLARVAGDAAFMAGDIDTAFIERRAAVLIPAPQPGPDVVGAAARALVPKDASFPWTALSGFRQNVSPYRQVDVAVGEHVYSADVESGPSVASIATIDAERVLFMRGEAWGFGPPSVFSVARTAAIADGALQSPMPGRIVSVSVRQGQAVSKGQTLLSLEAMKMEHSLRAPFAGTVAELPVSVGDQVAENVTLVRIVSL
jgi:3-methylcrotonyl-CoA carboxylase alpha subunit